MEVRAMNYSRDDALDEIFKRGKEIKRRQIRRRTHMLEAASFLLVFSLIGVIGAFSGTSEMTAETLYGSVILSAETGAYLIVAGIAFVLGIVVTLTIQYFKKGNRGGNES